MPELPDVIVYVERLDAFLTGREISGVRMISPSLVKTFDPPVRALVGKRVLGFSRSGKRIVFELSDDLFVVLHLMITGRLRWRRQLTKLTRKRTHGTLDFEHGSLVITEASTRKRASLHVVRGAAALRQFERGGLDVRTCTESAFSERLKSESRTLKRGLTDPRLFDGIGNAYSDEILHRARLSPVQLTSNLNAEEVARLLVACRDMLTEWTERLRAEVGDGFPEKVTAFRPGMAVHGRFKKPCPDCGAPVQRIAYADRETNYCAACQTGGRLLADRALSRLLKEDWPRRL